MWLKRTLKLLFHWRAKNGSVYKDLCGDKEITVPQTNTLNKQNIFPNSFAWFEV